MDIPRIIWQTWKTRDIPEQWQVGYDSVRTLNPGWRHVLMTDEDNRAFVQKHFPGFLNIYDAFPYPIQRADAIRYMLLYVHGGIYLDLDYEALRPFDDLVLDRPVGLVKSGNIGSFATNSLMVAARRHHPFWLECIAEMRRPPPLWAVSKHLVVMATTGPLMVHRVAKRRAGYVRFLDMQLRAMSVT
ncbi:MIPC synthase [Daphnia sinensis]|uniref:MIPC synthase n=1 Tax=Daphnia sinensis TaxID=1820382 RepID=A0AAD5KSU6_9CRUS|nr:MIPC synthase [Daphnia sinensis]